MTTLRTAAQQALEALALWASGRDMDAVVLNDLVHTLQSALVEPVQKPVSVTDLQEALVYANLIDRDAIDDPAGYDGGSTLAQIDALHRLLFKLAETVQEPQP